MPQDGIEPPHPAYKTGPLPLRIQGQILVPRARIELTIKAYQASVIPFNYRGINWRPHGESNSDIRLDRPV